MTKRVMIIMAVVALFAVGCNGDDDNAVAPDDTDNAVVDDATVRAEGTTFVPDSITVEVGTTVAWENDSGLPHTVTDDDGTFDETLPARGSVQVTFDEPGTYSYTCTIHPGMGGEVIVTS